MIKPLRIKYERSESVIAQGGNINKAKRDGFYKANGGNGSYRMNKPSIAIMEFEVNGIVKEQSIKELIRQAYKLERVGEKQANRFLEDVKLGKIQLQYEKDKGLSIV